MALSSASIAKAIPPLEVLDNKRTTQLLRLLERREPASLAALALVVTALLSVNWLGVGLLLRKFQFEAAARGFDIEHAIFQVGSVLGVLVLMLPVPLLMIAARDWWFKRVLRRRVLNMDCVFCCYPLVSLEVVKGAVCCPECGTNHRAVGAAMIPAVVLDGAMDAHQASLD